MYIKRKREIVIVWIVALTSHFMQAKSKHSS